MRVEEAKLLSAWVRSLGLGAGEVCLNVGSSTAQFRQVDQPHIETYFIQPLLETGLQIIHCDSKSALGVDEVGNVLNAKFRSRLRKHGASLLVCSNLLEHLEEPEEFARACSELVIDGGYGIFSVPSSYPYHQDPIDTMLRPSPAELAAMLPGWTVLRTAEIETGSYWQDLRKQRKPLSRLVRHAIRVAAPFYRPRTWRANASRLSWLYRPYKVSVVLMKKVA